MEIPVIHTIDEIIDILDTCLVLTRRISDNMYWFGIDPGYQIGSIAISQNELRCRFHYSDGNRIYTNTFIYDQKLFMDEIDRAKRAYRRKKKKEMSDILETFELSLNI